jgi:flagellar assembly protein FliH
LINPLVRDPLAIEQEEKRVIEEKVRQGVAQLAEAEKKSSFAIGYEEGLSQGYEDAFKKIREENFEKIKQFNQLVNEIDNAKIEIFRANERFLIELIFRIARFVLLKELAVDKEFLLRLAVELVEKVGARDFITLKINQEDAEALDLLKSGLEKAYGKIENLKIELSAQVKKGGCQIETEWNVIGTHIDTQLAGIYEGIMGSRRGAAS